VSLRHIFLSPYRCRECRKLFWPVGRRVYHFAAIVGIAALVGAIGGILFDVLARDPAVSGELAPDAGRVEATMKLAGQSDPVAEYELARMYATGQGVRQDEMERIVWLERSAEHGNAEAQYELGIALRNGRGVIQDFGRAATWLQRAAQSGNGLAQLELGLMYRAGSGIATSNVKAYIWLNLAAAQGIAGADIARDAVLRALSPAEVHEAQAEARRLSEAQQKRSAAKR
jgi:TPR repeat protein